MAKIDSEIDFAFSQKIKNQENKSFSA